MIKALAISAGIVTACIQTAAQSSQDIIRINQVGYYPNAPKIALVTGDFQSDEYAGNFGFFVLREESGDTVFKNSLGSIRSSLNSNIKTRIADFTSVTAPGRYILYIPGIGTSYPFGIDTHIHRNTAIAVLKGFYYQRSDIPLEERHAGKWHRPGGHPDTAVSIHPSAASGKRKAGTIISSPGGWYDAGDYNKYIVNSGITVATMLSAYEDFSEYFDRLRINIPESNNEVADILDEALYNIRWMLTMQDPTDGGVYHKCTNAAFDGMVKPGATKLPRYVVQKGTAATLDFSAVMAQAARIFQRYRDRYPRLSDTLLQASLKAWAWAQKNPNVEYNQQAINETFQPAITTGAYGDRGFTDEWFWAASELYCTTRKPEFNNAARRFNSDSAQLPSWNNVRMLGHYTMARHRNALPADAKPLILAAVHSITNLADAYLDRMPQNAFRTVMGGSRTDFNWGSNSNAANQGILLLNAYLISSDKKYIDGALSNCDYLLGRNATGYSFITGIGSRVPMRPHHRPSIADDVDDPVPGLLVGGPNPGMQDKAYYLFRDPETAYSDTDASYASNEIAINWNAPAVYLFHAIEALSSKAGYQHSK